MHIAVLSPHRDDAAFSLGLAIESWLLASNTVTVINCFTVSSYAPLDVSTRTEEISGLRCAEDQQWRAFYRSHISLVDLELQDAPERLGCPIDRLCSYPVSPDDPALEPIASCMQASGASAYVLPLALGAHVDHATASHAAIPIAAGKPCAFYEDLPYAARPAGEQAIDAAIAAAVAASLHGLDGQGGTDLTASYAAAPPKQDRAYTAMQRKRMLIAPYCSQMEDAALDQIARFSLRYGGRERLWVNREWRACAELQSHPGDAPAAA